MALPSWFGRVLPCGCVRGVKLCPDAERLWDAVADANHEVSEFAAAFGMYSAAAGTARRGYEQAFEAFTAHVEIVAESAVQGAMPL